MVWSPFGRFAVGFTEAEWDRADGQVGGRHVLMRSWWEHLFCASLQPLLSPQGTPTASLQPVAGRLFYPAPADLKAAERPAGWLQPWRWAAARGEAWLPHINYSRGLAKFLFFRLHGWQYDILQQLLVAFSFVFGKAQRLDLARGAPLAADAPEQLPLVVFSHGLGGNRFL